MREAGSEGGITTRQPSSKTCKAPVRAPLAVDGASVLRQHRLFSVSSVCAVGLTEHQNTTHGIDGVNGIHGAEKCFLGFLSSPAQSEDVSSKHGLLSVSSVCAVGLTEQQNRLARSRCLEQVHRNLGRIANHHKPKVLEVRPRGALDVGRLYRPQAVHIRRRVAVTAAREFPET
jgi:hypothetical protein